jgi:ferredoxin
MAKIIIDGKEQEVADGDLIMDACDELGVPFGCRAGQCAACTITIVEGMENLEPPTRFEEDMGLANDQRLACQAVIRSGVVVARY